jgi:ABC transporter fused permease/ATP-binding protein
VNARAGESIYRPCRLSNLRFAARSCSKFLHMAKAPRTLTLRRILAIARPERTRLIVGTFFLATGALAGLLYPQGIGRLIDDSLSGRSSGEINTIALLMLLAAFVQAGSTALRAMLFSVAGERAVTRLRERFFSAILDQEVAFFDERRTGELTSRLSSDASILQSAVSANISMVLRNIATAIGALFFLFYTSPRLTLVMLAVVPAVAIGAVLYGRSIRKLSKESQDALAKSNEVAEETISSLRTVRSFVGEKAEEGRYNTAVQAAYQLAVKRTYAGSLFVGAATFASFGSAALVFWYGARLVIQHRLTVGGLSSFFVYTLLVAVSMGALADLWADFMKSLGAAERIFEILDRVPAIPAGTGAVPAVVLLEKPSIAGPAVSFDHVQFAYPTRSDVPVLRGLDLQLRENEAVALVGPSGAGKSTVASLLMRFYDPSGGAVSVFGRDVRELDPKWLRQQIGTVAQEPVLFSNSIADNIRYARPDATQEQVLAAAKAAHAHDFISKFPQGYDTLVGERGVQLSGGQKQRVAIARALLKDPKILILDEATSALDAESESLVRDALDTLMKGRTTLIIAHRLSTVLGADRVVVLDGGVAIESGTHQELLARGGLYKRLVEKQFAAA